MAWSWSHTQEAYDNVRDNLCSLPEAALHVIFAEWAASVNTTEESYRAEFDADLYAEGLAEARETPIDMVQAEVWEKVKALAVCDNGGFEAWVCPYGCHTLPFDLMEE
jgi:hypothetical protein